MVFMTPYGHANKQPQAFGSVVMVGIDASNRLSFWRHPFKIRVITDTAAARK
jgi:hypothetical protein